MIGRIAILVLLGAAAGLPARADHDHRQGAWGGLLPPVNHGTGPGAPMVAPPVVVDPLFGAATTRPLPNLCLQAVDTPDGWRRF